MEAAFVAPHHIAAVIPAAIAQGRRRLLWHVAIAPHGRRVAHLQDAFAHALDHVAIGGDQPCLALGNRIAQRLVRRGDAVRMRAIDSGASFRCAIAVGDAGIREQRADSVYQRLRVGGGTHEQPGYAVEFRRTRLVAQMIRNHCHHGRHTGQPGCLVVDDRLHIAFRREHRLQDHLRAIQEGELQIEQRVHVIHRRGDDQPMLAVVALADHLHHPVLAAMAERHALGPAGGAGGIEELRRLVRFRHDGLERAGIGQGVPLRAAEQDARHPGGGEMGAFGIGDDEPGVGILRDQCHGLGGQLPVDRHHHDAGAHGTEIERHEFRPVRRQHGDGIATLQTAFQQAAGQRVGQPVQLSHTPGAWRIARRIVPQGRTAGIGAGGKDGAQIGGNSHRRAAFQGTNTTLPKTLRSISACRPSLKLASVSGSTRSITGSSLPSRTIAIRAVWSSGVQALEPTMDSS